MDEKDLISKVLESIMGDTDGLETPKEDKMEEMPEDKTLPKDIHGVDVTITVSHPMSPTETPKETPSDVTDMPEGDSNKEEDLSVLPFLRKYVK